MMLLLPWSARAADTRPNILYLLADQWRASATGYAGDPNVRTPHLDRLAAESQNFRNAVSVCPVCTPHRASLMTGRFPTSTGMFLNDLHLPGKELCMAEIFADAGYTTGYIGKWHLDGRGRSAFVPPASRQGWQYWKAGECDHDYNHSHYYTGDDRTKHFWEGYDSFAQTRDARAFLRDHAGTDQPFILFLSFGTPHFSRADPPEEFMAMYPKSGIRLSPDVPDSRRKGALTEAQRYYAHCTAIDGCIGDLMKTLDETGLAKNTLVVFSSDHGETLGGHGVPARNKQVAWSDSAAVPFLLRGPSVAPRAVETPITTPDILPTLLGLAGVKKPDTLEGDDLSESIREGRDLDRAALYMGVSPFLRPHEFAREYRAIRTRRHTYVRSLEGPWLLFDHQSDPYELHNLAGDAANAGLVETLDARLTAELKEIGDDFRPAEAYLKEWGYDLKPGDSIPYSAAAREPVTPRRSK